MSSTRERAWLAAHQKGSKALVQRLDKAHANNPDYQAFKKKHGLGDTSSVKQVSKSTLDRAKEKARQTLAGKAYGATKGTRMGSAEGTGETLRDTIAPLTRDQHSAVKAAEREAKAAEKPAAAPKKPAKPKKEKAAAPEKKKPSALELIAAAAAKRKINQPPVSAKALRRIAAVGDMEHDHGGFEDLGDTQYGGRRSYNEEAIVEGGNYGKPYNNDEDLKSKSNKELQSLHNFWKTRIEKNPNHSRAKDQLAKIKAILASKIGKKANEEVENFKVGDKVKMHTPNDLDWHERNGELISTSDDGHVVKLNDGTKLSATKHQIKKIDESHAAETLGYMLGNFNSDHSTRLKHIAIAPTSHLKYLLKNNMGSRVVNRTNDNGQPVTHPMIKRIKKELAKRNVQKEEAEQVDEMKYGIGTVVKLKKPVDGHEYATVKGFTSSGSTRGPTGRGVPMPAGKVKKVKVALRKNDDHSYYAGPVTHIEHDDVHSVIRESAPGWMLKQNPELAKKVKARIAIARNRQKQMGNPKKVEDK